VCLTNSRPAKNTLLNIVVENGEIPSPTAGASSPGAVASTYPLSAVRGPVAAFRLKVCPGRITAPSTESTAILMFFAAASSPYVVVNVLTGSAMFRARASSVLSVGRAIISGTALSRGAGSSRTRIRSRARAAASIAVPSTDGMTETLAPVTSKVASTGGVTNRAHPPRCLT